MNRFKYYLFSVYRIVFAGAIFEKFNKLLLDLSLRGLGILNHGEKNSSIINRMSTCLKILQELVVVHTNSKQNGKCYYFSLYRK